MKTFLIKTYNKIFPILRRLKFRVRYRFKVMSPEATVTYIKTHNCSILGMVTESLD